MSREEIEQKMCEFNWHSSNVLKGSMKIQKYGRENIDILIS